MPVGDEFQQCIASYLTSDLVHFRRQLPREMPPGVTPGLWEGRKERSAPGSPGFALRALGSDLLLSLHQLR